MVSAFFRFIEICQLYEDRYSTLRDVQRREYRPIQDGAGSLYNSNSSGFSMDTVSGISSVTKAGSDKINDFH
jgi:hypothetical protein